MPVMMHPCACHPGSGPSTLALGFSMIEVLVSIVILVIGLLGLAGLQAKAHVVEMEAYQRAQALTLLWDMESRIRSGRGRLDDDAGSPGFLSLASTDGSLALGTGDDYADCSATAHAERDICDWSRALKGAAEVRSGSNIGAMLAARGCLIAINPPTDGAVAEINLVVVWQGVSVTADPEAGTPGSQCASDTSYGTGLRRAAVTRILIPKLKG